MWDHFLLAVAKKSRPLIWTETNINNDQMIQDCFTPSSLPDVPVQVNTDTIIGKMDPQCYSLICFQNSGRLRHYLSRTVSRSDLLVCLFQIMPRFNTCSSSRLCSEPARDLSGGHWTAPQWRARQQDGVLRRLGPSSSGRPTCTWIWTRCRMHAAWEDPRSGFGDPCGGETRVNYYFLNYNKKYRTKTHIVYDIIYFNKIIFIAL
jgi:hypothetical protein